MRTHAREIAHACVKLQLADVAGVAAPQPSGRQYLHCVVPNYRQQIINSGMIRSTMRHTQPYTHARIRAHE